MRTRILTFIFAVVAMTASATVTLYPALPDSVDHQSASLRTGISNVSGSYIHRYLYQEVGDTMVYADFDSISSNLPLLWRRLDSLKAATTYIVNSVVCSGGVCDTSNAITFTTKSTPAPPDTLRITNILVNPGIAKTVVNFHYEAVGGYSFDAQVLYQSLMYTSPTIRLSGIGDTSIDLTNPNVSGTTYALNYLQATIVGNVPGIPQTYFIEFDSYTVPSLSSADVVSITASNIVQDSITFTARVVPGNTGLAQVTKKFLDANSTIIRSYPTMMITTDSTFSWTESSLATNTDYIGRIVALSAGGNDSLSTGAVKTLQVPEPVINNWLLHDSTLTTGKITVYANTNGNYPNSVAKCWITWRDKNNVLQVTDTIFNLTGAFVIDSFMLTNLKSGPANNSATIYVQNAAGLMATLPILFQVASPHDGFPLQWGILYAVNSSRFEIQSVSYVIPPGTIGKARVVVRKETESIGDTITAATGLTGSGTLNPILITGREGGTKYYFKLIGESQDGLMQVNPDERWEITITPDLPQCDDINIATVTDNGVTGEILGNGNGTQTEIRVELYKISTNFLVDNNPVTAVGTDEFSLGFSFVSLDPNTEYRIRVRTSAIGGVNPVFTDKDFITTGATGVEEEEVAKRIPDHVQVVAINIIGQTIGQGKKGDMLAQFPNQTLFLKPVEKRLAEKYGTQRCAQVR